MKGASGLAHYRITILHVEMLSNQYLFFIQLTKRIITVTSLFAISGSELKITFHALLELHFLDIVRHLQIKKC